MPTILITGAAGQIGTMLRPRLARPGRTLRLLDIADLTAGPAEEVVRASVTDMDAMTAACRGASAVIHLAGIVEEAGWDDILRVNIQGSYVAFEAARRAGVPRVIFASSNHAVGFAPRESFPVPDYAFPAPDTYYGVAKVAGEGLAGLYHYRYGLDTICIRILSCFEKPAQRPVAVHLAVPGRRRAAVRGVPDHPGPRLPGGVRRLGQHPRRLGQPPGSRGAGVLRPGRRGVARRRGGRRVRGARSRGPGVPLPRRRVHPARAGRRDPLTREAGMRAWANLYPWDVDGDPAEADRMAGLGLAGVALAAAYHAVRAVTPFHPEHRIVTRDAAVYYHTDPARWEGAATRLRPVVARPAGSFERAAAALRSRGLAVTAWAVVTHHDTLGAAVPSAAVRNAFGDAYPWALCLASPAVRDYATALAGEVAALPDADTVELEACGWYGVEHLSAHDKTAGAASGAAQWLLSVCFCPVCRSEYAAAGADPAWLAAQVRAAVGSLSDPPPDAPPQGEAALAEAAVDVLTSVRAALASRFQREVIAAARDAAPGKPVYLHFHPDPRATGANPGYQAGGLAGAAGVVLSCWDPATAPALVVRAAATVPQGTAIAASLLAVAGLGGDPATLPAQAAAVRAAGATELRLYHAGLAAAPDLAAIAGLCSGGGPAPSGG
jgi:hypothetical protein